jgi:predicted small metal-binding protein
MRVIECDICGDTITGEDDEDLVRQLTAHMKQEHDQTPDEESLAQVVAEEAYDAMDS